MKGTRTHDPIASVIARPGFTRRTLTLGRCTGWLGVALIAWALAVTGQHTVCAQGRSKMIWSDRVANTVRRANLDGSGVEILASGMSQIRGVALDRKHGYLYWADNGSDKIQRSLLDGSQVEDLVTEGLSFPAGIALDVDKDHVYWADASTGKIQRANLDGSNVKDLITGLDSPYYVTLDRSNRHLYWTDQRSGKIQRSDLNGQNIVDLVTGLPRPRGIDLHLGEGRIYWSDRTADVVQRSDLDGGNIETIHTATPSSAAPHGVAVHQDAGHLYWVDNGLVTLKRSNLDGSDPVTLFDVESGQLTRPWQIVLDLREPAPSAAQQIDQVSELIRTGGFDASSDFTRDGLVTPQDRDYLIHHVLNSGFGDANLDGWWDSKDMVAVFVAGEYEDAQPANSTWATGDWNGDGEFDSADFVDSLQRFQYNADRVTAAEAVPEPSAGLLAAFGLVALSSLGRGGKAGRWFLRS